MPPCQRAIFQPAQQANQRPQHQEVDDGRHHDGRRIIGEALRLARLVEELGHGHHAAERGELYHFQRVGQEIGHHIAHGLRQPGDPVHDIRLRLAVDDTLTVRETGTTMFATPYPSCIDVEGILQRLVGERIGKGWREAVRRKIGRLETCTHLAELLGPAVTTLFQTMSNGRDPEGRDSVDNQRAAKTPPFFIDGCHSWRKDGPNVAELFPQFATKEEATD